MTDTSLDWLTKLKTPNADVLYEVLDELRERDEDNRGLGVETKLDRLIEDRAGLSVRDHHGRPVRSVLVIAHAGDGKSHFFQQVEAAHGGPDSDETIYRFDPERVKGDEPSFPPGLHIFNDPSQTEPRYVAAYLSEAFKPTKPGDGEPGDGARFLVGINRGKFRDVLPEVKLHADGQAFEWLQSAMEFEDGAHHPDAYGRMAVPLDRRVLVPSPGERFDPSNPRERSPVGRLADGVLRWAARDAKANTELPVVSAGSAPAHQVWSQRIEIVLALVEASGHHVTFREAVALSADVAAALVGAEGVSSSPDERRGEALARLFQFGEALDPLANVVELLRRLDPARVASPRHDVSGRIAIARDVRDCRLRREGLDRLVELFRSPAELDSSIPIPHRYGTTFLEKCRELGTIAHTFVNLKRQIRSLEGPENSNGNRDIEETVRAFGDTLEARPAKSEVSEHFFRGLATFAWGPATDSKDDDIMPLTSPLQPGTLQGSVGWRVMRGAISQERAYLQVDTTDFGPYVERGLARPEFVLQGPAQLPPSPPLPLDLELFERLARMSEQGTGSRALGQRESQVRTWLDSVVSHWEKALLEEVDGLVVFETLLGDNDEAPVALRPSKARTDEVRGSFDEGSLRDVSVLDILTDDDIWPARASAGNTVAITAATCASALLQWAGFEPKRGGEVAGNDSHVALREAAGAAGVARLRTRTNFTSPAFPWSDWMLGVGLDGTEPVSFDKGKALGAACAAALDLDTSKDEANRWAEALRTAWAGDEEIFDVHPSARFCHQWLELGIEGLQLKIHQNGKTAPADENSPIIRRVFGALLDPHQNLPFSPVERWWLLGTWAAWRLMLRGLKELHEHDGNPVEASPILVPSTSQSYEQLHSRWFCRDTGKRKDHRRDAVAAVGQAAGFLTPSSALTRFDLTMDGALQDIIRLVAWDQVRLTEHDGERTVTSLQSALREGGLFVRKDGPTGEIPEHLPLNAPVISPGDDHLDRSFRLKLSSLGLLDLGSDGKDLFVSPWTRKTDHDRAI